MSQEKVSHLDMVLVELLGEIIPEEIIFIVQPLALILCPLHILLFSSIPFPVIYQTQYKVHTILPCLRYHKIQCLSFKKKKKKKT